MESRKSFASFFLLLIALASIPVQAVAIWYPTMPPQPAASFPTHLGVFTVSLQPGWNLISVPLGNNQQYPCRGDLPCPLMGVASTDAQPQSAVATATAGVVSTGSGVAVPGMMYRLPYATLVENTCETTTAYYYDPWSNSYQKTDVSSLEQSKGYWVKASSACKLSYEGQEFYSQEQYSNDLQPGWNMISAPYTSIMTCPQIGDPAAVAVCGYEIVKVSDLTGTCSLTSAYEYDSVNAAWVKSGWMTPGKGYFVKVSDSCTMYSTKSQPPLPPSTAASAQ